MYDQACDVFEDKGKARTAILFVFVFEEETKSADVLPNPFLFALKILYVCITACTGVGGGRIPSGNNSLSHNPVAVESQSPAMGQHVLTFIFMIIIQC